MVVNASWSVGVEAATKSRASWRDNLKLNQAGKPKGVVCMAIQPVAIVETERLQRAGLLSRPVPRTSSENWRGRVIWETMRRSVCCWT